MQCSCTLLNLDEWLICPYYIILQGTAVRVEFGDGTTAVDPADAPTISRAFPHTYGQPLAHFLRATAKVPDAQIITEHPAIRCVHLVINFHCLSSLELHILFS